MTGRGIDQMLPYPVNPVLHTSRPPPRLFHPEERSVLAKHDGKFSFRSTGGVGDFRADLSRHRVGSCAGLETKPHRHRVAGCDRNHDLLRPIDDERDRFDQLANCPAIVRFFRPVGTTALVRFFDKVANAISARLKTPRAVSADPDVSDGRAVSVSEPRHCLFCLHAGRGDRRAPPATQSGAVPIALAVASNIGGAATLVGNPQNMMIAQIASLDFGRYAVWSITPVLFALGCAYVFVWTMSRHKLSARARCWLT